MLNPVTAITLLICLSLAVTAPEQSIAETTPNVVKLKISNEIKERIAALPDQYQNFLLSDRIFFISVPRAELIERLEGKSVEELEQILEELIWLDSKLTIRTSTDSSQVNQQNLNQINESLDRFIAD